MFGTTERERLFSGLVEKGLEHLRGPDYRTKGLSEKDLHHAVLEGALAGVDAVLAGLKLEVGRIMSGTSTKKQDEVAEAFQLGLASVRRLMGVADVKDGTASWVAYATAGLPQPRKALQGIDGWDGVFSSSEEAEEKSASARQSEDQKEYFWITKARERAGERSSTGDRDKFLADARSLMDSEPEDEVITEVLDLAAELWPGKCKKDLAEMIQFKGG